VETQKRETTDIDTVMMYLMTTREKTAARRLARDARREAREAKRGAGYESFRTGLSYAGVVRMMRGMPCRRNAARLRSLSRSAVLGFWHELKQQMWAQFQDAQRA